MIPHVAIKQSPVATPGIKPKCEKAALNPAFTAIMNATMAALQTTIRNI